MTSFSASRLAASVRNVCSSSNREGYGTEPRGRQLRRRKPSGHYHKQGDDNDAIKLIDWEHRRNPGSQRNDDGGDDEENASPSDTETDEPEFEDYYAEEANAKQIRGSNFFEDAYEESTQKVRSDRRKALALMGRSLAVVCSVPAACWGLHQAKAKTRRRRN